MSPMRVTTNQSACLNRCGEDVRDSYFPIGEKYCMMFEERLKEALADEELSDGIEQAQDLGVVAVPGESLTI